MASSRPPPFSGLYRVTADPEQLWYVTNKKKAWLLANALSRICLPETKIMVEQLEIQCPPFYQPVLPHIIFRRNKWQGAEFHVIKVDRWEFGRNNEFTVPMKLRAYKWLQGLMHKSLWPFLLPLSDLVFLERDR